MFTFHGLRKQWKIGGPGQDRHTVPYTDNGRRLITGGRESAAEGQLFSLGSFNCSRSGPISQTPPCERSYDTVTRGKQNIVYVYVSIPYPGTGCVGARWRLLILYVQPGHRPKMDFPQTGGNAQAAACDGCRFTSFSVAIISYCTVLCFPVHVFDTRHPNYSPYIDNLHS